MVIKKAETLGETSYQPPLPESNVAVSESRAAFDKALAKNGLEKNDTRIPPEQIWKAREKAVEGEKKKDKQERDEIGGFKKLADVAPNAGAAPTPAHAVETDDDDEQGEDDFDRAKTALRRDGFTNKEFAHMERDRILAKGLKAIKRHERTDEAYRIAKGTQSQPATGTEPAKAKDSPEPAPKPADFGPVLAKLKEKLALDDEGVSALNEFATLVGEHAAGPLRQELKLLKSQQTIERQGELGRMLQTAQAEVGESFPDLMDPDTFAEVLEEANAISGSKQFQRLTTPQARISASIKVAAINLGLEKSEESAQQVQADAEGRAQRRISRSTVGDRMKPAALNSREKDWHRFNEVADKHGIA
jgi:hypothetical protein